MDVTTLALCWLPNRICSPPHSSLLTGFWFYLAWQWTRLKICRFPDSFAVESGR